MHHNLHHQIIWGNYAPFLTYFDRLCGLEVSDEDSASVTPEWQKVTPETTISSKAPSSSVPPKDDESCAIQRPVPTTAVKRPRTATPPPRPVPSSR